VFDDIHIYEYLIVWFIRHTTGMTQLKIKLFLLELIIKSSKYIYCKLIFWPGLVYHITKHSPNAQLPQLPCGHLNSNSSATHQNCPVHRKTNRCWGETLVITETHAGYRNLNFFCCAVNIRSKQICEGWLQWRPSRCYLLYNLFGQTDYKRRNAACPPVIS